MDGREWIIVKLDGYCAADLTSTTGAEHSTAYEVVPADHLGELVDVLDFPASVKFLGTTHEWIREGRALEEVRTPGPGFSFTDVHMEALSVYSVSKLFLGQQG